MKLTADILAGLTQATLGLNRFPLTEGELDVPALLSPTITIPLPWNAQAAGGTLQRTSFGNSAIIQVANAGAGSTVLGTLGRGLWRVAADGDYSSNYDGGVNITGQMQLLDPTGNLNTVVMAFQAATGAFQHDHHDFVSMFLLPSDGWFFRLNLTANGVGQSHRLIGTIICAKLI